MTKSKDALAPRKKAQQERAKQRFEHILDITKGLLIEHPSHQITTIMIAEKAGISIGSLYQFFPKKEAVFYELFRRWLSDTVDTLDRVQTELPDDATKEQSIDAFLSALADPKLNSQTNWRLRFSMSSSKELAKLEESHRHEVLSRVHRLQDCFGTRPPSDIAGPVMSLQNELTIASLLTLSHMAGTPAEAKLFELCKKLLLVVHDYDKWDSIPCD